MLPLPVTADSSREISKSMKNVPEELWKYFLHTRNRVVGRTSKLVGREKVQREVELFSKLFWN